MRVLDLFSGIGGFSLGLERAGMKTVAFCEIEPFCRRVLAKHWPGVPCYEDVRTLTAARLAADGISVDLICGGFPCQDISLAGSGAGLGGARSGLWWEYARLISELRPGWAIIENVTALRSRGLDGVLGALASLGYDAEWHCVPASAVGAPHRRDRLWIVAHANSVGSSPCYRDQVGRTDNPSGSNPARERRNVFDTLADGRADEPRQRHWGTEPGVGRVADGVPGRVDRLKALGNSVVPQIPELIGRAILRAELAEASHAA